jgi:hypothetical protein
VGECDGMGCCLANKTYINKPHKHQPMERFTKLKEFCMGRFLLNRGAERG